MRAVDFRTDLILRWPDPQVTHIPLLKQAGIQSLILPQAHPAFANAGFAIINEAEFKTFNLTSLPTTDPGPYAALSNGLWPGIRRQASNANPDVEGAAASREPWVDSNAYWIAWLRALYPNAAPVLAYEPNEAAGLTNGRYAPFETLVLALAEARVMGGNYVLALEPRFRTALLNNDEKAVAAWKQLALTAKWLDANKAHFGMEAPPMITELVEPSRATAEIANLLFRRCGSPRLVAEVPERLAPGTLVLVATAIKPPARQAAARMLEHVSTGGVTLVTDDSSPNAWWRSPQLRVTKTQADRVFHMLGKGAIVSYNRKIVDPSEHALDVIDLVGHPRRAVRTWNANSTIAVSSPGIVNLLNYSGRVRGSDTQVRIQGVYKSATLLHPGAEPVKLLAARRGTTTEVFIPDLGFVGTLIFR